MRNLTSLMAAIIVISMCTCSANRAALRQPTIALNDVCELSTHPERYAGQEIRLSTKLINSQPHGLALHGRKCPVPLVHISFSTQFEDDGRHAFDNTIDAYLADQVITRFRITVLGHLDRREYGESFKTPIFYFDKIVSLEPDQPPIEKRD